MIPIKEITVPLHWDGWKDLAEFESRFDEEYNNVHDFAIQQVENSCSYVKRVLAHSLAYFLERKTNHVRMPITALSIPETCHLLLELTSQSACKSSYKLRFKDHLEVILHYDEQRSLVLKRLWNNPAHIWLFELSELADSMAAAAWELDEGMSCEHEDYEHVA